jgi:hypothetical protein
VYVPTVLPTRHRPAEYAAHQVHEGHEDQLEPAGYRAEEVTGHTSTAKAGMVTGYFMTSGSNTPPSRSWSGP